MRAVRGIVLVLSVLAAVVLLPATASAQAADAQGWWSAQHHQSDPVTPPGPPDVGEDDLLLQGGDPGRLLPPGALDSTPQPSALAALRFQVDPAAQVLGLALEVGAGAQAADVRAYPTTSAWVPAQDGPIEQAPEPDLARFSSGLLSDDGTTLTFPDIGRLVTEQGLLSVVLVPGAADRVVVHKPTATALTVLPPTTSEPSPQPTPPPPVPTYAPPVQAPVALPPFQPAGPAPAPSVVATTPAPQPVTAPPVTRAAAGRRIVADDRRTRVLVALEAVLVLVFFGLLGQGPLAFLARMTGQPVEENEERGLGRFRSVRTGRAPSL